MWRPSRKGVEVKISRWLEQRAQAEGGWLWVVLFACVTVLILSVLSIGSASAKGGCITVYTAGGGQSHWGGDPWCYGGGDAPAYGLPAPGMEVGKYTVCDASGTACVAIPISPRDAGDIAEPHSPPGSATPELQYQANCTVGGNSYSATASTPMAAASACINGNGGDVTMCSCSGGGCVHIPNGVGATCSDTWAWINAPGYGEVNTCPTGYTVSGETCTLTDPGAVERTPNAVCTFGLTNDSADCTILTDPDFDIEEDGGTIEGKSGSSDAPFVISPRDGGGTIITQSYPGAPGTTTTFTDTVQLDSLGRVTGSKRDAYSGTGDLTDSEPTPVQQGTCGGPGQLPCATTINEAGTPDGEGAAASAISEVEGMTPESLGAPAYNPGTQEPDAWAFIPSLSGTEDCQIPWAYQVAGTEITFDTCAIVEPAKAILGWGLWIAFCWYAFATGLSLYRSF